MAESALVEHWFWSRLERRGDCWIWPGTASAGSLGYAAVRLPLAVGLGRRMALGHRVAWWLTTGRWPPLLRHLCDTPRCVNPAHLREGTQRDNIHDCIAKGRARNGNLKLTPEQWTTIRESTESSHALAAIYGVSVEHVRRIRRTIRPMIYRP